MALMSTPNSIAIEFLVREVGVELTKMLQANYPDNMRRMFVINGNWFRIYLHSGGGQEGWINLLRRRNEAEMKPKWRINDAEMTKKWPKKWRQYDSKMTPKWPINDANMTQKWRQSDL